MIDNDKTKMISVRIELYNLTKIYFFLIYPVDKRLLDFLALVDFPFQKENYLNVSRDVRKALSVMLNKRNNSNFYYKLYKRKFIQEFLKKFKFKLILFHTFKTALILCFCYLYKIINVYIYKLI